MPNVNVKQTVEDVIIQIAKEQSRPITAVEGSQSIIEDLGFNSLDLATLISLLEVNLNVDPFVSGKVSIADIRTVDELCKEYEKCLNK